MAIWAALAGQAWEQQEPSPAWDGKAGTRHLAEKELLRGVGPFLAARPCSDRGLRGPGLPLLCSLFSDLQQEKPGLGKGGGGGKGALIG